MLDSLIAEWSNDKNTALRIQKSRKGKNITKFFCIFFFHLKKIRRDYTSRVSNSGASLFNCKKCRISSLPTSRTRRYIMGSFHDKNSSRLCFYVFYTKIYRIDMIVLEPFLKEISSEKCFFF